MSYQANVVLKRLPSLAVIAACGMNSPEIMRLFADGFELNDVEVVEQDDGVQYVQVKKNAVLPLDLFDVWPL